MAHAFQTHTRYQLGDLVGRGAALAAWLRFVDDPVFRQVPGSAIWTFGKQPEARGHLADPILHADEWKK